MIFFKAKVCTQQRYVQYKGMYMSCATPVQDKNGSALLPQLCPIFGFCALSFVFHLAPLASGYTLHRKLQKNERLDTAEVEQGLTYESYLSNRYLVLAGTYCSTSCHVLIVAVRRWKMDFRLRVKKPSSEPTQANIVAYFFT